MIGISKKRLEEIAEDYPPDHRNHRMAKYLIATECQELQEPWMTLDEFLKSGFDGLCWICLKGYPLTYARFSDGEFDKDDALVNDKLITHVQPIHKPEPPR